MGATGFVVRAARIEDWPEISKAQEDFAAVEKAGEPEKQSHGNH
jgi:hypothetical protein